LAKTPFILDESQLGATGFFRYYLTDQVSVRGGLAYGKISGDDLNKETSFRRNLSFESDIMEVSAVATYDIFDVAYENFVPYVYGGVAYFKHNPKADLNGTMVELQPLGTEGQGIAGFGNPYSLGQISVPFGAGAKMRITDDFLIMTDYGARKTFTDHLDDVSRLEYVDPNVFQSAYGATDPGRLGLLQQLAYRGDELAGGVPYADFQSESIRERFPRNLSDDKDWYYQITVGVSYMFGSKYTNPIEKNRKRVPYRIKTQKKKEKKEKKSSTPSPE
ncbi:MAG: outer membrane beta-barrel protein, partial [Saprospiraceae bacterium]|nr:outer membrane beta-barrel protein [Saprospiraceae bacterium]